MVMLAIHGNLHVGGYKIMFAVTGFPIWSYVAIGYNFLAVPLYGQVRT